MSFVCYTDRVLAEVIVRKAEIKAQAATPSNPANIRQPASLVSPRSKTYVLEHRETKRIVSFEDSTVDEVVEGLSSANIDMEKWHSCSGDSQKTKDDLETIEKFLDMELLIESLGQTPAPELNDAQRDWVKSLSPCVPEMRLHLKALSLILGNHKLVRKPDDA